jgi:hypothetical protein
MITGGKRANERRVDDTKTATNEKRSANVTAKGVSIETEIGTETAIIGIGIGTGTGTDIGTETEITIGIGTGIATLTGTDGDESSLRRQRFDTLPVD